MQFLPVAVILALAASELRRASRSSRESGWTVLKYVELLGALVLYMVSGPAIILTNKHVMRDYDFKFPIMLASLGNALLMVVTRGAVATGLHKLETPTMEWGRFIRVVIPVICLNFFSQVSGMWAYQFISVPLIEVLKSATIVLVLIFAYCIVHEPLSLKLAFAVFVIAAGTCVCASFDEGAGGSAKHTALASIVGVLLALFGCSCEAGKTVFCQVMMERLSVFDSLYWASPSFTLIAVVFCAAIELRGMAHYAWTAPLFGFLALNAALTGLVILSSFWLTKLVGAVALKVLTRARTIGLILIAVFFFGENCASMQYLGFAISLAGVWIFTRAKQELAAEAAADGSAKGEPAAKEAAKGEQLSLQKHAGA